MLVATQSVVMNRNDEADQQIGRRRDRSSTGPCSPTPMPARRSCRSPKSSTTSPSDPLCTVWGNEGRNILTGTDGNDVICGRRWARQHRRPRGNDLVIAGTGNDTVDAGTGLDTVNAGAGNDTSSAGTAPTPCWAPRGTTA
jgi:hypothetical protein